MISNASAEDWHAWYVISLTLARNLHAVSLICTLILTS